MIIESNQRNFPEEFLTAFFQELIKNLQENGVIDGTENPEQVGDIAKGALTEMMEKKMPMRLLEIATSTFQKLEVSCYGDWEALQLAIGNWIRDASSEQYVRLKNNGEI